MRRFGRYYLAAGIALILSILCVFGSVCALPTYYQQVEPEDAVSVMDTVRIESESCEWLEDGSVKMTSYDPHLYLSGITGDVYTLCVKLGEPIPSGVLCQLYYIPTGCEIGEENSVKYISSVGQDVLYFTIDSGECDYFRLDIDCDYFLEDILVSQQIPDVIRVEPLDVLLSGDLSDVNVTQWAVSFVILLAELVLIAWKWEKLRSFFAALRQKYSEHRGAFWIAVAIFAFFVVLSLAVYGTLCALGTLKGSFYLCFYFLMGGCALGGIIALRRQAGEHPERPFLVLVLSVGLVFAVASPKATIVSLDDETHYHNALKVSYCGQVYYTDADYEMINQRVSNEVGLEQAAQNAAYLNTLYRDGASTVAKTDLSLLSVAYLPSGGGIWLARLLGLPFTAIFCAGRIGNLLCFALVTYFAVKRTRKQGLLIALFALIPTVLFTASHYSYDAWCVSFLALGTSIFLDEYQHKERPLRWSSAVGMLLCLAIGCIPKAIYFPIFLIALFMPREKFDSSKARRRYCLLVIAMAGLVCLTFAAPFLLSRGAVYNDTRGGANVNARGQTKFILFHPLTYAAILLNFLKYYFTPSVVMDYAVTLMGYMKPFSWGIPLVILFLFVFLFERPKEEPRLNQPGIGLKLSALVSFFCAVCLAATAMYIAFTAVGAETILGCQERYMLPVLLPTLMLIRPNRTYIPIPRRHYCTCVMVLECLIQFAGIWSFIAQYSAPGLV